MVVDDQDQSLFASDNDSDGVFDQFIYGKGVDEASYSLIDVNMDGIFNQQYGPGRRRCVHLDGAWYELVIKDEKHYIDMNGQLTEVRPSNGVWSVVSDNGDS